MYSQRRVARLVGLLFAMLLALQASPLLLWHFRYAEPLAEMGGLARLETPSRSLEEPLPGWSELVVANLSLRLPLDPDEREACARCRLRCVLGLEGGGTLAVFDSAPPEDLHEARDRFAPHPGDLSLLRPIARNWETIDALADRARATQDPPAAFRFEASGSRGVLTSFEVAGRRRYVIYAYGPGGEPTRTLGVTGVSERRLDRILGGLVISDAPDDGPAHCDGAAQRAASGVIR